MSRIKLGGMAAALMATGLLGYSHAMQSAAAEGAPAGDVEAFKWMAGSWVSEKDGEVSEEHWMSPLGGAMVGMNRTVKGDKMSFFEYLRIMKGPQGIAYIAHPAARNPGTVFMLKESGEQRVVFENPKHDYPQRVIYRREGDTLHARIEGAENGKEKSSEWSWQLRK